MFWRLYHRVKTDNTQLYSSTFYGGLRVKESYKVSVFVIGFFWLWKPWSFKTKFTPGQFFRARLYKESRFKNSQVAESLPTFWHYKTLQGKSAFLESIASSEEKHCVRQRKYHSGGTVSLQIRIVLMVRMLIMLSRSVLYEKRLKCWNINGHSLGIY